MSNNLIKAYTIKYAEDTRKVDSNEAAEKLAREYFDKYVADNIQLKQISFDEVKAELERPELPEFEEEADEIADSSAPKGGKKKFKEGINFAAIFGYDDEDEEDGTEVGPGEASGELSEEAELYAHDEKGVASVEASQTNSSSTVNAAALEEIEQMKADAQTILVQAKQEADDILTDARAKASDIRDEARSEGYSEAISRAQEEIDARMAELDQLRAQLEADYEKQVKDLEPAFVEMAIELAGKLIGIHCDDKKEILTYLLECGMNKVPRSNCYIIRLPSMSEEDAEDIKNRLREQVQEDADIEIVEDRFLSGTQCLIETDSRIFDCSLDSMQTSLFEAVRLLSITN